MIELLLGVPGKLKTLLDRLTATRAGYLDTTISSRASSSDMSTVLSRLSATAASYLDAAISSRASSSDMSTVLSRLSSTRAGYLDNLNSGTPIKMKSIQWTSSYNIGGSNPQSVNVPIAAVNSDKIFIHIQWTASSNDIRMTPRAYPTSSTNIYVERGISSATEYTWFTIWVYEFY
jgi:hypothetical protein